MQKFLEELCAKLMAVVLNEKSPQPEGEVGKGETVVGVLPDDLKRLWIVHHTLRLEMAEKCAVAHKVMRGMIVALLEDEQPSASDTEFAIAHKQEHERWNIIDDMYDKLFWQGVREAFPSIALSPKIGLRGDWQVVRCPDGYREAASMLVSFVESL